MRVWVGLVFAAILVMAAAAPGARADITNFVPSGDDIYINESTTLANGFYVLNDSNGNGVFIMNASNIVLDCNGSSIFSNDTTSNTRTAIYDSGFNNITITNCIIYNYVRSIYLNGTNDTWIFNNRILNVSEVSLKNTKNVHIFNNAFLASYAYAWYFIHISNDGIYKSAIINISGNNFSTIGSPTVLEGVSGELVNNITIEKNNISGSIETGIGLNFANYITIFHNNISGKINGLYLGHAKFGDIRNNFVRTTPVSGTTDDIYTSSSSYLTFNDNDYIIKSDYQYLHALVLKTTGGTISANITVYNLSAGYNNTFDSNSQPIIPQMLENRTGTNYSFFPIIVNVSSFGYVTNSSSVNPADITDLYVVTLSPLTIPNSPVISAYNISTPTILTGSALSLAMYASSSALSSVWINLSYPNASTIRLGLTNGGIVSFTPPVVGAYNVTFFANDTTGNTTNASSSFTAVAPVNVNISVTGRSGASLVSNVTFYYAGTSAQAAFYSSDTGAYGIRTAPNTSCDIAASAYSGNLTVWLLGVQPSLNFNGSLVIDSPSATGFIRVYAINSSYSIGGARIRISYRGINVSDEIHLRMQKCADWSFISSSCSGNWTDVTSTADNIADYLQADISGFSAYGLKQGGYCGNFVCDSGETSVNCPSDCSCTTGATRLCSAAHSGQCAAGTELCTSGVWTGCPLQAAEVCDQIDNNCDGIIDNVNNRTSVSSTSCQCYNSGRPVPEACNGIDDNCNGQVDEGIQSPCGPDVGECTFGVKTCVNGDFATCTGGIQPVPEVCDNNKDDDCNGQVDEGCANNVACQFGLIPETGCRCGNLSYTGGYCCYGSFQTEACGRVPWELLIIFGVVGVVVGAVVHVTRKKNKESSWNELEKKYTPV